MRVRSCRGSDSPGEEQQREGLALCHAPNPSPAQAPLLKGSRNKDLYSKARFRLLSDSSVLALHIAELSLPPEQGKEWLKQEETDTATY